MNSMWICVLVFLFLGAKAHSLDPSTQTLIRPLSVEDPEDLGIRSGRYESHSPRQEVRNQKSEVQSTTKKAPAETPKIQTPRNIASEKASKVREAPQSVDKGNQIKNDSMIDEIKHQILGGSSKDIAEFKESIDGEDPTKNYVIISFGLGLLKNSSESRFSYRNYSSEAPVLSIGLDLWFTPFLSFTGSYMSSLNADISKSPTDSVSSISVQHDELSYGFGIRRFLGNNQDTSIRFDLLYQDYRLHVPASSLGRTGIKSNGIGARASSKIAYSSTYKNTVSIKLFPSLFHTEVETRLDLESGRSASSSLVGFELGGEKILNRANQLYWLLGYQVEKNVFSGAANLPDPKNSVTPSGVSVTNSSTYLRIGYRWGR